MTLLIPGIPRKAKEFAYFGFAITLISASIAHFSVGDNLLFVVDPLLFLGALITSYVYFNKASRHQPSPGHIEERQGSVLTPNAGTSRAGGML